MGKEIAVVAIGALIVWALQMIDKVCDRSKRRQSTLVAIASEIQAIANLLRSDQYLEKFHTLASKVRAGTWDGKTTYVVDIRSNFTRVFEANAFQLSELESHQVSKIVTFYTYIQSFIDTVKPDGAANGSEFGEDVASNILTAEGYLMAILLLADEIVLMPRKPLPTLEVE